MRKEFFMAQRLPEIKKRKDGYYEMKVTVAPYVRKSIYGDTPAEVRRKAKELLIEATRFDISNVKKMTVATYMTYWLMEVKKPEVKPGTFD
ncbi:MAG: hypothetical protein IKL31_03565, partial [Ruminococcus sp.]|nr:hypothetical protein [Ruminococcus sp.]